MVTGKDILDYIRTQGPALLAQVIVAGLVIGSLILISSWNYLLFHGIVEFAAIAVSLAIFMIVWNTRRNITDPFLILIGISFLFIGGIDLLHTLAYKGMGVFPGESADLPTQLWLAARYFQSITFLIASLLIGRTIQKERNRVVPVSLAFCTAFAGFLLAAIFAWQSFPAAFVEGTGLTPFKIASEYLISLILVLTIIVLFLRRQYLDPTVWSLLVAAQVFLIAGELSFTSYVSVYGSMNLLGHLFRLVSVYLFYRAIVVAGLTRPYDLLFRELKTNEAALARSEQQYRGLVEMSPDAIFINRGERIAYLNPAALRLFGAERPDQVLGRSPFEIFHPDCHALVRERIHILKGGLPVAVTDEQVVRLDGTVRDVEIAAFPFEDAGGPAIEVILHDITDRKAAERELTRKNEELGRLYEELQGAHEELGAIGDELRQNVEELTRREIKLNESVAEKEILLAEIHHRVKNNLTAFISLISLEGSYDPTGAGQSFRNDLQNRARSMALIHETLYQTHNFANVDMGLYLTTLVTQIARTYAGTTKAETRVRVEGVILDISRATPVGLIVNELVTNSFKYGFPAGFDCQQERGSGCTITVSLVSEGGDAILTVSDNGIGMPAGIDPLKIRSLGFRLITFLARYQLQGTVAVEALNGTTITIRFPDQPRTPA